MARIHARLCVAALLGAGWLGCARTTPPAVVSVPLALPPPPAPTVTGTPGASRRPRAAREEADFASDHGLVHLRSDGGGRVSGSYPNGVLTCTSDADRLECEWTESGSQGHAVFVARGDGGYDGTWGTGASATGGGSWPLARIGASAASLDGVYDTNWGPATLREASPDVHVDYGRGTMDCQRRGSELDCTWTEGGTSGRAELTLEPNGVLRGRWGSGASSSDGGPWVFVKR
ncbi:MAG TPA: hypothetical protein VLM85_32700 [Polyangiaceae bacterium]|nr:hypothetical protein [Polyangiaceae bacterium]